MPAPLPLIVFSHLRWDFVYQRPQHVLSRLAARRPVVFVEEPIRSEGEPHWEVNSPASGVTVCRPHTTSGKAGFADDQLAILEPMVRQLVVERAPHGYDLWFYTPMALPLAAGLKPRVTVFDKMDDLASFRFAPAGLKEREAALLAKADVVFTGGPSLHKTVKDRHPNAHCFPSSVDVAHFGRAAAPLPEPPDQADIGRPRLGFFGVLDERFDADLLAAAAAARPHWQFVLVGPVVKVDPSSLPWAANIHYLGQKGYADLPSYLAGWDVALLPFAHNESTRVISPTKVLEYMAAGKPVVSTRIADVAEPYAGMVGLGDTPDEFIQECEAALGETPEARGRRLDAYRGVLDRTSWDATVTAMADEMRKAEPDLRGSRRAAAAPPSVVVVGAGPTGLSAAYHLGADATLIEANATVGGWCRSVVAGGFTFDYAGHIMFSNDPYVHEMYRTLLGDNVHWQDREAWVYSKGVHTRYPFQGSLHGLPPGVIKECILGAVEARDAAKAVGAEPPRNFEEFIYKVWGKGIAEHFAVPYNRKIWAVPLADMETSWLGGRVPMPDLGEMIEGAVSARPKPMGPNARFGYPLRGGFQALMDGFLPHLTGKVHLRTAVKAVSPLRRTLTTSDGATQRFDQLVSTMPLPRLVRATGDEAPAEVRRAAEGLRHTSVRCVNLGVGREKLTDKHWIYYPEDTVFHRIFVQGNASPHCNPPGGFGLTCEITYGPLKPLPCDGDALVKRCIDDCVKVGLVRPDDPIRVANQVDMPFAYVVYDHGRAANVALIRDWLLRHGIHLAGRYSEWEYYNSDHAFLAGRKVAEAVRAATARPARTSLASNLS